MQNLAIWEICYNGSVSWPEQAAFTCASICSSTLIQVIHPSLHYGYDHILSKKNPDPGPLVVMFLQKAKCQLRDLFPGITEDSEDRCATKEEFFEKLRV